MDPLYLKMLLSRRGTSPITKTNLSWKIAVIFAIVNCANEAGIFTTKDINAHSQSLAQWLNSKGKTPENTVSRIITKDLKESLVKVSKGVYRISFPLTGTGLAQILGALPSREMVMNFPVRGRLQGLV